MTEIVYVSISIAKRDEKKNPIPYVTPWYFLKNIAACGLDDRENVFQLSYSNAKKKKRTGYCLVVANALSFPFYIFISEIE